MCPLPGVAQPDILALAESSETTVVWVILVQSGVQDLEAVHIALTWRSDALFEGPTLSSDVRSDEIES